MLRNVQPLFADFEFGGLTVAHNGNLTNALAIRKALVKRGSIFHSTSDTETIIHLVGNQPLFDRGGPTDRRDATAGGHLLPGRDHSPQADRHARSLWCPPLVLGRLDGALILSSETSRSTSSARSSSATSSLER